MSNDDLPFETEPGVEGEDAPPPAAPARRRPNPWVVALLLLAAAVLIYLFIKWVSPDPSGLDTGPAEASDSADGSDTPSSTTGAAPASPAQDLTAPNPMTTSSVPPTAGPSGPADNGAQDSSALIGGYTPSPH